MWELMYDLDWQLPAEEAEVAWRDASGATNVMQARLLCDSGCHRPPCLVQQMRPPCLATWFQKSRNPLAMTFNPIEIT